jgi:hypothetical protein
MLWCVLGCPNIAALLLSAAIGLIRPPAGLAPPRAPGWLEILPLRYSSSLGKMALRECSVPICTLSCLFAWPVCLVTSDVSSPGWRVKSLLISRDTGGWLGWVPAAPVGLECGTCSPKLMAAVDVLLQHGWDLGAQRGGGGRHRRAHARTLHVHLL